MIVNQRFDGFAVEQRVDFDEILAGFVVAVEPELIELVRTGHLGVEPDSAALRLAELDASLLVDN